MTTPTKPTPEPLLAVLAALLGAIVDAAREGGRMGAPAGVLYAALAAHGCTKQNFDTFMEVLVGQGKLVRRGDLYFAPEFCGNGRCPVVVGAERCARQEWQTQCTKPSGHTGPHTFD